MLDPNSKFLVMMSISDLDIELKDLEDILFEKISKKMAEKKQTFHFSQKILVSAFCSYTRILCLSRGEREKDLKTFGDLYSAIECNKLLYIKTGVYLLSVLRDMLGERCGEEIISAWGDTFLHVYTQVSGRPLLFKKLID